jgi:hypothetical protein
MGLAHRRMKNKEDVLLTEDGSVRLPHPYELVQYIPAAIYPMLNERQRRALSTIDRPYTMMACRLSGLLTSLAKVKSVVGVPAIDDCVTAWEALRQSDCQGADPHLWAAPLPDAEYLQRFGRKNISLS